MKGIKKWFKQNIKIIDLYILRKFLGTFFYAIALLVLIVVVFDISENIQDFIDHRAPVSAIIFQYYLNFIPYFVNLFSPLFTFISVIYFTSKLAGFNELTSILGSGISYKRLLLPYIIGAFILSIMSFTLSNFLIPYTNQNMLNFKDKYVSKRVKNKDGDMHVKIATDTYVYVETWNNNQKTGYNFTLEKMNFDGVFYKLMAQNIQWDSIKNSWTLNGYVKRYAYGMKELIMTGQKLDTLLNVSPNDFVYIKDDMETMNYFEIREYIKNERAKGSDKVKFYEVEKYKRVAFPFATIILSIIGLTLAGRKTRGGLGIHLAFGLLLSFSFIMFMQITTVFATYGTLNPMLAVWIPNIVYGLLSIYLIRTAPK
ncbi:MAG: LptF/LptG family permease [Bacteroidota bacterium]